MASGSPDVTRSSNRDAAKRPDACKEPAALEGFLPPVRAWFERTFERPSPAQIQAWPVIRRGENTLLLAPTGSGKTLAAFLCAIDDLVRKDRAGDLTDAIHVLYITPLKALGNDIQRNLIHPLEGIEGADRIRTAVRTGDTPQSERAKMVRHPPHILITTPESLYLLLQSAQIRDALRTIRTVIVDEVHALCDNKRGVHLSVSLERLERHVDGPLQRVGCSATLSPLKEIAAFLVGRAGKTRRRPCTVVDAGMRKDLDVRVMAPLADLVEAGNTALWASAYDLLVEEVSDHTTTLVFCNSRYKAERTGLRLTELAGEDVRLSVHHGSMARERRLVAEEDLKSGRLDALVATTSLELGIDIGSVDLVYQLESPKSVSTGLQRIGRAGHLLDATSKGRILVFERDELLEAAAICRAMVEGKIDAVRIPQGCLDVLAQQIVGAVVARDWDADELYGLIRGAYPYRELDHDDFDRVLGMLSGDFPFEMTCPPRAYVHWDRTTARLSATRGAKHVSSMNVGTISESSEYEVIIDGTKKRVGRVNSEFVDDSLRVDDVFVLGSTAWRVAGVRKNQLLVREAPGATPTVPWWSGPVQPRTVESGEFVGQLRREIAKRLDAPDLNGWLQETYCLDPNAASAASDYVREQMAAAGMVPDHEDLLVETWVDELGRANIILHSPFGRRVNHTWGVCLAEAARSHLKQDWQVTATNDHVLLSFPEPKTPPVHKPDAQRLLSLIGLDSVPEYATDASSKVAGAGTAFRDAASVAYQILRAHSGKRVPFWLQTHRAQELFEIAGTEQTYPIVSEVIREYQDASLDVPGLIDILQRIANGTVCLHFKAVESPSPFAHSLLIQDVYESSHQMGRSRRAHLLRLHREVLQKVLSEEQMAQLLDPRAIERVERRLLHRSENRRARSSEELAQALRELGDLPATLDALSEVCEVDAHKLLNPLFDTHSVVAIDLVECDRDPIRLVVGDLWREYHDAFAPRGGGVRPRVLLPRIVNGDIVVGDHAAVSKVIPAQWRKPIPREEARRNVIERYLRCHGPVTPYEIANHTGWAVGEIETHLSTLVDGGVAAKGVYIADKPRPQFVNRVNLEEIHRLTMGYLKRELEACAPYEVVDFMTRWQHLHPDTRLEGLDGLREVIAQLQGFELVTGALESEMIGRRVKEYRPEMLDRLIASGEVCWRRFGVDKVSRGKVALCLRQDAEWLSSTVPLKYDVEEHADADIPEAILTVRGFFRDRTTAFFDDVLRETGIDEGSAMRAVWYLAWAGEVTCDTYLCLRESDFQVTLSACYDLDSTPRKILNGRMSPDRVLKQMRKRGLDPRLGRWSATERLIPPERSLPDQEKIRRWADQLLRRWGIVTRDILEGEVAAPSWGHLLPELKRLELLGKVSRGYFIESHHGEQYGLPDAIELLRECRARRSDGNELGYLEDEPIFSMSSRDPANLYATSLDIIDEQGEVFRRVMKRGNIVHWTTVQAGQAFVYNEKQLVRLSREQLRRCIESRMTDGLGGPIVLKFRSWNGYPIDVSPVAPVLHTLGFRMDGRRWMCHPPRVETACVPMPRDHRTFLPYYEEPSPVEYGPEWTVSRTPEKLRPALEALLPVVERELVGSGWDLEWGADGPRARYRGFASMHVRTARSFLQVNFHTRSVRVDGKRHRLAGWQTFPNMRIVDRSDVNHHFLESFLALMRKAEEITDLYVASKTMRKG